MKQRIISAAILALILIPITIIGGTVFDLLITVISCLALRELLKLNDKSSKLINGFAYILMVFFMLNTYFNITSILCIILLVLFIPIIFYDKDKYNYLDALRLFAIITFLGISFSQIRTIRDEDVNSFIYLFSITILTDTFAYIGGKLLGKHKLIPKVSPNKTIEGTIIGSLVAVLLSSVYYLYNVDPGQKISIIWCISLVLSFVGQLGDLFFSSIKRYHNVKDFSNLIPGHGGILDRFDSAIFVFLMYTIILSLI